MIGETVKHTNAPHALGGKVECRAKNFNTLYGVRGRDGHLYWLFECDFSTRSVDLFSNPLRLYHD